MVPTENAFCTPSDHQMHMLSETLLWSSKITSRRSARIILDLSIRHQFSSIHTSHLLSQNVEVLYYTNSVRKLVLKAFRLGKLTLLSDQKTVSLLQGNTMSGVLVVWREASWVSRLGDLKRSSPGSWLGVSDLLEGVKALALWRKSVHQMHPATKSVSERFGLLVKCCKYAADCAN